MMQYDIDSLRNNLKLYDITKSAGLQFQSDEIRAHNLYQTTLSLSKLIMI